MDTTIDDGGPVGPIQQQILPDGSLIYSHSGMTLRDYYAGQALLGLIGTDDWIASSAYGIADAMIKARKEPA